MSSVERAQAAIAWAIRNGMVVVESGPIDGDGHQVVVKGAVRSAALRFFGEACEFLDVYDETGKRMGEYYRPISNRRLRKTLNQGTRS